MCARYGAESPGSASDGRVTVFIRDSRPGAPESLAADEQGNVFGGFIEMQALKKVRRELEHQAAAQFYPSRSKHQAWGIGR